MYAVLCSHGIEVIRLSDRANGEPAIVGVIRVLLHKSGGLVNSAVSDTWHSDGLAELRYNLHLLRNGGGVVVAEVDVIVHDPSLYHHISKHGVNIFLCIAVMEFFLTPIYSKFDFTCLVETPCAVKGQLLPIRICRLRAQYSEPFPRVKVIVGDVGITKILWFARSHLENCLVLKIVAF